MITLIQKLMGKKEQMPRVSEEKLTERHQIARQRAVGAFNDYLATVDELLQTLQKDKDREPQNNNTPQGHG